MGHIEHRTKAPTIIRVAVLSVSSTRGLANDVSGNWIAEHARSRGHTVVAHEVVPDDINAVRQAVLGMLADAAPEAIIVTGGTGISPKDVTIEALHPQFTKELSGFGALFTQLSYNEVKSAAIISRATAGIIGSAIIFCLPGSLKACQLACNDLIFPELGHLVGHAFRE